MELFRTVKLCMTGENSVFWNDILCVTNVYSVCIGTQFDLYFMLAPNLSAINGDQLQLLPIYNDRAAKSHDIFTNESPDFGAEIHVPQVDVQIPWYFRKVVHVDQILYL